MIVVDASVLIGHLDRSDVHHERATWIFHATAGDEILASPVTLAEVLVGPARSGGLRAALASLGDLGVTEVPFGPDAAGRLATLRAETNLKLPDCCVLLAAEAARAPTIATFDERLATAARRAGIDVLD